MRPGNINPLGAVAGIDIGDGLVRTWDLERRPCERRIHRRGLHCRGGSGFRPCDRTRRWTACHPCGFDPFDAQPCRDDLLRRDDVAQRIEIGMGLVEAAIVARPRRGFVGNDQPGFHTGTLFAIDRAINTKREINAANSSKSLPMLRLTFRAKAHRHDRHQPPAGGKALHRRQKMPRRHVLVVGPVHGTREWRANRRSGRRHNCSPADR